MWPGATVPPMYLTCDGRAISRTAYPALFAALGTTWGVGDGTSTFNLPDMRGRAPIGAGTGTGLTARALGAQTGAETVLLDTTTIPAHTHPNSTSDNESNNHYHGVSITSGAADRGLGHSHSLPAVVTNNGGGGFVQNLASPGFNYNINYQTTGGEGAPDHLHGVNGNTGTVSAFHTHVTHTPANTGGGAAHANVQPSIVVNYIIFTGVP
jgi:microcystin-dependent protein